MLILAMHTRSEYAGQQQSWRAIHLHVFHLATSDSLSFERTTYDAAAMGVAAAFPLRTLLRPAATSFW